jgi:tryptophan synthase alpha chain
MQKTIAQAFANLKGHGLGLMPFLPAGYPDLPTTIATLKAVSAAGATVIEVGFPFSDPIADGPTIQAAFTEALSHKLKIGDVFDAVQSCSGELSAPLVAMVSHSIVFRLGPEKFFARARAAGFAGMIIPDLPPPEAQAVCKLIRAAGLDTILLVSPTTSAQRRKEIAALCSGFIYYLSISGITGTRDKLPPDLAKNVRELKGLTDKPVCVGFGIHTPEQMKELATFADGAIVGSAIVKLMGAEAAEGPEAVASAVAEYCRRLLAGGR